MATQNLYWITHRESNLLRRPFQRQSITVLGTQTSVSFLQKLPGVAQTSLFASESAPLAPPHLTSAFRRPCQSCGRPCAPSAINPPTASSLDICVCEFSARKSRCSRRARVRNSARVAISRRCRSEGFRINRTCLARVHRRSHRRTANPVERIHLPSFPRARAPCAFARVTKRRR